MEYIFGIGLALIVTLFVYLNIGLARIRDSYALWFKPGYWVNYNVVEFWAWMAKAIIILPGLVWHVHIWQFHFITLFTSGLLIWASEKKLLPTFVAFNTLWIFISSLVIARNLL